MRRRKKNYFIKSLNYQYQHMHKFPDSRYDRCNTEVGPLDIGFVDINRIKLAKNRANLTALVLEMLNPPVLQTTNSLVVYQSSKCMYQHSNCVPVM